MDRKAYILDALRECVLEELKEPRWGLPKGYFEQRSYTKWATQEAIHAIEKYNGDPKIALEWFVTKMDRYACLSRESGIIFSVAYDVGQWMLDLIYAMEE